MMGERSPGTGTTSPNNFDVLRLAAALAVLVSHGFVLSGRSEPELGGITLGELAVLMFFGISGFLITQSWQREPRLGRYLTKRMLRILPPLLVVVFVTVLVLGPYVTTTPLGEYFRSAATWQYLSGNTLMVHTQFVLPGVFIQNPYPSTVNGSLWTLATEMRAYLVIGALGAAGLLRSRRSSLASLGVLSVVSMAEPGWLGDGLLLRTFLVGGALLILRDRVPLHRTAAVAGLVVWLVASGTPVGSLAASVAVPYATITAAYRTPRSWARIVRRGDLSYGIYLWAFPVEQVIALYWHGVGPAAMIALSMPLVVGLGAASWVLIERPALRQRPGSRHAATVIPNPAARLLAVPE